MNGENYLSTKVEQFISTPRPLADVNGTAQLVALWLHGLSSESKRAYECDLRTLIGFLTGYDLDAVRLNDIDLRQVNLNDLQAFIDYLEDRKYSPASVNRKLAAIKSLFDFGHDCGFLPFNVASRVKGVKQKDTLSERILSEFETMRLLNAQLNSERDRLLLEFLYRTGARVSEVAKLTWKDIKPNRDGLGQVTLFGKGGKTRNVILHDDLYRGLLETRSDRHPDSAVFVSRKGQKPLQVRQIRKIVADAARDAGIDLNVSPHWLRHAHASHSLDRGAPPQLVQQTLGHASLDTLTRYAHAKPTDSSGLYLPK